MKDRMNDRLNIWLPILIALSCVASIWGGYLQIRQYYRDTAPTTR